MRSWILVLVALWCAALASPTCAGPSERRIAEFASGDGNVIYLAAGAVLPLLTDGDEGPGRASHVLQAVAAGSLASGALKRLTQVKRPDADSRDSFPSGHATAAFTVATLQSHYHPNQAAFWYAGAAVICWSRVCLSHHRVAEVLAGAALGHFTARWEIARDRGLLVSPLVAPEPDGGCFVGLRFCASY